VTPMGNNYDVIVVGGGHNGLLHDLRRARLRSRFGRR
jgi:tRNA U34 5-carboxymethylaminomethyl modifying enzyme MnmG/GidA